MFISNHFEDYLYQPEKNLYNESYNYLINKQNYNGIEYRFICWLNYNNNKFTININKPFLITPKNISFDEFKNTHSFSNYRNKLLSTFQWFVEIIKEEYKLISLEVIVGGSFTDKNIDNPNDIDIILLIPDDLVMNDSNINEHYLYTNHRIPRGIDVKFLPENYSLSVFKAYSNFICLCNNSLYRDKDRIAYSNNEFSKRDLYRFIL